MVLSGGRRLEGGRWGEVNGRQAWVVDNPEVKAGTWRFRQLFVNGTRRPRTRLPKQGEYRIESLPGYTGDFLRSPTKQFVYTAGDIVPGWRNLQDVEVVGLTRWLDNRLPIESVNGQTRTVTFDRPSLFALHSGNRPEPYWVENVFEALDSPGQWYLICYRDGKAVGDYGSGRCGRDVCAFERNLYWNASGKAVLFGNKSFAEWRAAGQDKNSLIADPLFVDPARGDFRLRPGSPAVQVGFQPWDLSTAGPRQASAAPR